jgi:CheY-specific phosphatase CheX
MSEEEGPGFDESTLKKICRDLSLSRIKVHSCIDDITVREQDNYEKKDSIGQWLSLIFVSSHAVKLNFKCQFYNDEAAFFTSKALDKDQKDITKQQVDDFVKEFCNLSAGAVKKSLEGSGLTSLISLPLMTRGSDDVFFKSHPRKEKGPIVFSDSWDLIHSGKSLTCHIYFEIYDKEAFQKIILNAFGAEEEEDGEIDFF